MEQTTQTPQGKGMGTAGFVISLVALVLYFPVAIAVTASAILGGGYGLGIFWAIVSLLGTIFSIMGMMKLGKTGGKRGLAIAGLVLGIVASLLSIKLVMGISAIHDAGGEFGDKFKDAMEQGLNKNLDSSATEMGTEPQNSTDSTTTK